jgi:hypothetical protein
METGAGVRSSDRIRAQPNADDTQLQRAQRLAQAKDHATSPGTNFINKYSLKSFSNEVVVATASKLGISLGKSPNEIEESVDKIKNLDIQRTLTILKKNEEKAKQNTEDASSFVLNKLADMVCPRRCGDGRRGWICVGKERTTSNFLSDLGVPCALRSPASGGEDTQAPDCLLFLCARVLFVILEALSSNIRFYRTIEARGPPCNYVPAAFNGCF